MKKVILTLLFCTSSLGFAASELNCRTHNKISGWKAFETFDYFNFKAILVSSESLLNAQVTGAYDSDSHDLIADPKYKPKASRYANFNRFGSLEDAWNWFVPLFPKDLAAQEGAFTSYVQIFDEEGFKGTIEYQCFITDSNDMAKILLVDSDKVQYSVAFDKFGELKIDGEDNSYPSIKNLDPSGEFVGSCYQGSAAATRKLLQGLVDEADGDGDSWVKNSKITYNDKTAEFIVAVVLEDESSSENARSYSISPCF